MPRGRGRGQGRQPPKNGRTGGSPSAGRRRETLRITTPGRTGDARQMVDYYSSRSDRETRSGQQQRSEDVANENGSDRWSALVRSSAGSLADKPKVSRAMIEHMERAWIEICRRFGRMDPVEVMGVTQGAYISGYGVVFMSEVNLAPRRRHQPFSSLHHARRDQAHA